MALAIPDSVEPIGRAGLHVSRLAYGGVPLGNYPTKLSEAEAAAAISCAYDLGIRYFDVAPLYGHGLAEHRLGAALRGVSRDSFVLSTKVGRLLVPEPSAALKADPMAGIFEDPLPFSLTNDYSYDGIMRSVEDSLQRMGLASIDILHIHNIDPNNHAPDVLEALFSQCMADGYRALEQLRSEGTIKAIGVGNNSLAMCERFARAGDFDCFMMAGHFNLLDQGAIESFLPYCKSRGIRILLGSPFASGLLVAKEPERAFYMYKKPNEEILGRVHSIRRICADHGVSIAAAALQFPLLHPVVACIVPGMRTAQEVSECVKAFTQNVPGGLFADLQSAGLIEGGLTVQ
ncbi:aldo/keto reductase [Devosia rhodophyticola]|uniref:Aldo/keto reductase n=1 Tax=Devosia rhodophyticola TaxID=3026423 RepID=A0ABY7YVL2_9HYPH|nr:aldo/keto reductase [Devosia rhodophyticola]WDR05227.1 aldo/keto reductase [Devosia rhodophyticola]